VRDIPSPAVASLVVLVPAALACALAYDGGGYSIESRSTWAIGTWWLLGLACALGWSPARKQAGEALAVGTMAAAFALLTLASALWAANDADAFSEFNRVSFYIGAFGLTTFVAVRVPLERLADGIAVGLAAVSALALLSRVAPGLVSDRGLDEAFPEFASRLSHPIGYWNGLAILVALAVPLLLRAAAAPGPKMSRGLAVAPLPAIATTIYLASSRGGFATAAIGALAYLALSHVRWRVLGALVASVAGSAIPLATLLLQSEFVNAPTEASTSTRGWVGLMVLLGCVSASVVYGALAALSSGRTAPRPLGIAVAGAAVALGLAAVVAADPVRQLQAFKQPPATTRAADVDLRSHLVSAEGSGRWQFWEAAVDAWREKPLHGHGAGSYEAWWAQHGTIPVFVRDAHSLYLETFAELGVLGLALLAAFAVAVILCVTRRLRLLPAMRAETVAAAFAVVAAYAVAAGIDWVWELPAVTVVAAACLGIALSPRAREVAPRRMIARAALTAVAMLAIVAQAIPYLSDDRIRASQSAAAAGDLRRALSAARDARDMQPWSPDPWLQLALVHEQRGELEPARRAIARATAEDRNDWRLWLVAARVQTKLGEITLARSSLRRAIRLNPRSPLFDSVP
jgi:hypothetical protein